MPHSDATTRGVRITVESRYLPQRSVPSAKHWFFIYTVQIENVGTERVQLLARHWIITNGNGEVREVRGPGVVGEQPLLAPGQRFEYTSACPLDTSVGTMHGSYQMVTSSGEGFDATIEPFALAESGYLN